MREVALPLVMQGRNVIARDAEVRLTLERLCGMRARLGFIAQHGKAPGEGGKVEVIDRVDVLHGIDRFGVATRDEVRPAEMAPEPRRMERIESHRLADPLDAFLRQAEPSEELALLYDDEIVVWIEGQRARLVIGGLVVVVLP